jgi:hypothetical protein
VKGVTHRTVTIGIGRQLATGQHSPLGIAIADHHELAADQAKLQAAVAASRAGRR